MKEVNYNGGKVYIDDSEVPIEETGVYSLEKDEMDKTREI